MTRPLLIAGVGNMFLGDDAFGCEVTRRLRERHPSPRAGVELRDFGASVRALAYELAARAGGHVVIVDAVATGAAAGTVHWLDLAHAGAHSARLVAHHAQGLADMLGTARALGATLQGTYLLGCEPGCFEPTAALGRLTREVEAAAVSCIELLDALILDPELSPVALCLK